MSMLAERKRKQKWSLNPRGNNWIQDSNKFGQKMLEKMGWQHGKGLGAKEDGITEHIKVSYKNDSKGMGFKDMDDQWTEHESNFTALLASLSGEKPVVESLSEVKLNSLEKKSQTSRARVHYHKFTRGKDLSRCSEKDLANIFGKKSLIEVKETPKQVVTEEKNKNADEREENQSKFLLNAGSMRDYFKKKIPSFGKTGGYVVGSNGVLKKEESDSESEFRPSFGFISNGNVEETSYTGFGYKNGITTNKTINGNLENASQNEFTEKIFKKRRSVLESDIDNVFSPKKKLRKSKDVSNKSSRDASAEFEGLSNPAFDPLSVPIKVKKRLLTTIEESVSEDSSESEVTSVQYDETVVQLHETPKKKKKNSFESNCSINVTNDCENGKDVKKKKSKKTENGVANSVFLEDNDIVNVSTNDNKENEVVQSEYEVKRKENKKKKKQEESLCGSQIEESIGEVKVKKSKKRKTEKDTSDDVTDLAVSEESSTKTKKKKKNKNLPSVENPAFVDDLDVDITADSVQTEENPYEVKINKKNKKKKKKEGLDNANFNESTEESSSVHQIEENPYEVKLKEKKKKKKEKNLNYAIENPNFNESLEKMPRNEMQENPYEVKPKKNKKKRLENALAIDNPNFTEKDSPELSPDNNAFEVERTETRPKNDTSLESPLPVNNPSLNVMQEVSLNTDETDLMLNVVSTPIIKKSTNTENGCSISTVTSLKRRKSVRFSDVTQERIIPNNEELRDIENRNELFEINNEVINNSLREQNNFDGTTFGYGDKRSKKNRTGLDNAAFDKQKTSLEENLVSISETIDKYEAEIDNDINEKKLETLTMDDLMVGEVGNPKGENQKLPHGTKLKFKYANFNTQTAAFHLTKTGSKKSYKHLIKGDIIVAFRNTNLHEIDGYASKRFDV